MSLTEYTKSCRLKVRGGDEDLKFDWGAAGHIQNPASSTLSAFLPLQIFQALLSILALSIYLAFLVLTISKSHLTSKNKVKVEDTIGNLRLRYDLEGLSHTDFGFGLEIWFKNYTFHCFWDIIWMLKVARVLDLRFHLETEI